jgi:predicted porin
VIDGDPSELDNLMGVNWTLNYDWLTARIAYFGADVSVDLQNEGLVELIGILDLYGLDEVSNDIKIDEEYGDFLAIGLSADYNNFIVDFEIISSAVENSISADQNSAYLSLGYRFDELTLLATIENRNEEYDDSRYGQIPAAYGTLGASVDGLLKSREIKQDIVSLGARYNFHPSAALKFDYTNSETNKESRESVMSVGVDLVF